ncbi:MAG: DNA methyltransferase [Promethearchaeota archaeon]
MANQPKRRNKAANSKFPPPLPSSFAFDSALSVDYRDEQAILPTYHEILQEKQENLQAIMDAGIQAYNQVDMATAAKKFRKLAHDLKLIEYLITDKGNKSDRNSLNDLTGKQWLQHTKSWVVVDGKPGSLSRDIKNHPASFPPSLAEYFISFFTKKNHWVFDPFMGIGSTAAACATLHRNCLGIELNPIYAQYAAQRTLERNTPTSTTTILTDDARHAVNQWKALDIPPMDFLITSPPYWNMLAKSRGGVKSAQKQRVEQGYDEIYSQKDADLGNIEGLENYMESLVKVFKDFKPMLRSKAYLMVILQNCRPKDGIMRPLAWDFARKLEHYTLRQEFIWCQDQKFSGIWGYPTTYVSNVHHHYCLVFQNM